MPSKLYTRARALLEAAEAAALDRCEGWLGSVTEDERARSVHGARVLENLRREAHFCGHGRFGEGGGYAEFLRGWVAAHDATSTDAERCECYQRHCQQHVLRGSPVPKAALPPSLLRYVSNKDFVARLVEAVLGIRGRQMLRQGQVGLVFSRLAPRWDPRRIQSSLRLSGSDTVFATLEHPGGAPRDDVRSMAEALALPVARRGPAEPEVLVELAYEATAVRELRIPTVADAQMSEVFQPAPERRPDPRKLQTCYGWTRPLGPHPPQPEVVHANESLQILSKAPRLLGRSGP